MAVSIITQPDKWSSAYRPMRFVFRSDRLPNARAGESFIPVISITQNATGLLVTIAADLIPSLEQGETITIANTDNALYSGRFRVLSASVNAGLLLAYIDGDYVGDDTGGTASRYYDDLKMKVKVQFLHTVTEVNFTLSPIDDEFVLDVADAAARQFERIFDTVDPALAWGTISDSRTSIAQEYVISAYEQWTSWDDGVPSVSDSKLEEGGAPSLKGQRAINCVHPYHKEEGSAINVDWSTDLGTMFPMVSSAFNRRFLTWSRHQDRRAGTDDPFYLSWLCETSTTRQAAIRILTYNSSGVAVGALTTILFDTYLANTISVGPDVLPPGTITDAISYYTVAILNSSLIPISEELRINIDRECAEVGRRIHWRNKLGGIDQYTFKGREMEQVGTDREAVTRLSPPLHSARFIGTWRDRTHRVMPIRRHRLTTDLILVSTLRYLSEDCFESADHAIIIRDGWWTNLVMEGADSPRYGSDNVNGRVILDYAYGMDNLSQTA